MGFSKGVALVCWVGSGWARACTMCDSGAGRQLRGSLFDGSFSMHLLLVALPFPLLAAAVAVVQRMMPEFIEVEEGEKA